MVMDVLQLHAQATTIQTMLAQMTEAVTARVQQIRTEFAAQVAEAETATAARLEKLERGFSERSAEARAALAALREEHSGLQEANTKLRADLAVIMVPASADGVAGPRGESLSARIEGRLRAVVIDWVSQYSWSMSRDSLEKLFSTMGDTLVDLRTLERQVDLIRDVSSLVAAGRTIKKLQEELYVMTDRVRVLEAQARAASKDL